MEKSRKGTYYLSRVLKGGLLKDDKIVEALQKPKPIVKGNYGWTITKFQKGVVENHDYFYGRLTKYQPDGEVNVIDHEKGVEVAQTEVDLVVASSPFVFIPSESAIAHLHVWNKIEEVTFQQKFSELIVEAHNRFFVECNLESISNLQRFYQKIKELDSIHQLSATIRPPNPLFGPIWRSLKDYLEHRSTCEMKIEEKSSEERPIKSDLRKIISEVLEEKLNEATSANTAIGDAAILMAADGYGHGKIVGSRSQQKVTIRTSETTVNFLFDREPEPDSLFRKAYAILIEINKKQKLKH